MARKSKLTGSRVQFDGTKKPIKFIDIKSECEEDRKFDKKKPCPVGPRTREAFKKVKVTCSRCGEKDEVSPALVTEKSHYICNSCCVGG